MTLNEIHNLLTLSDKVRAKANAVDAQVGGVTRTYLRNYGEMPNTDSPYLMGLITYATLLHAEAAALVREASAELDARAVVGRAQRSEAKRAA